MSLISIKIAERSEAKKREAKLRVKIAQILIFDAKLRFALLSFASVSHLYRISSGQQIGNFTRKG